MLPAAWVCGTMLARLAGTIELFPDSSSRFHSRAMAGLLAQASAVLAASTVMPVAGLKGLAVWFGIPALALIWGPVRRQLGECLPPQPKHLFGILLACAACASGPVFMHDTGMYHYQAIRWLASEGTLPGIAMLHHRLGFSSSWLAASAVFDFGPWEASSATVLNGLLFALMTGHWIAIAGKADRRREDLLLLAGYPVIILLAVFQRMHVSPSPNLPVGVGILLSGWCLEKGARGSALMLAASAFAVKANAAPALAIAAVAYWGDVRTRARVYVTGALLALPLIAANLISSGCPMYPSSLFCLETPSSVGDAAASRVTEETLQWARYGGPYPAGVEYWSLRWLPGWLQQPLNALLVMLVAGCLLALRRTGVGWAAALGLTGTAYVLAAAPDFRFVIGYAAILSGCLAMGFPRMVDWTRKVSRNCWVVLAIALVLINGAAHEALHAWYIPGGRVEVGITRLLKPVKLPAPETRVEQRGEVPIRVPVEHQCWAAELGCTPYPPAASIRFCDAARGWRGGLCR